MGSPPGDGAYLPGADPVGRAETLRSRLIRHGIRPAKSLGQHFLVSPSVVSRIVGRLVGSAGILEIGPGPGVLTGPLAATGAELAAVELDPAMQPLLQEVAPRARIVLGDALATDLRGLLLELPAPRAVVSNMPYNITGPLMEAVAREAGLYERAVLMVQREVGEKVLARPGDRARGAVSVMLQAEFDVTQVCAVPPGAFLPPPKVESVVLELRPSRSHDAATLAVMRSVVRAGFAQPRKTLANTLGQVFPRSLVEGAVSSLGLPPSVRAHQLHEREWLALAQALPGSVPLGSSSGGDAPCRRGRRDG